MKLKLLLAALFLYSALPAQFQWVNAPGASAPDAGNSLAVDGTGNVYSTGTFRSTVDFDPGPGTSNLSSAGFDDIFVTKNDPSGNLLWAVSMGGGSNDISSALCTDANGNIYITGVFNGVCDFDPGAGTMNLSTGGEAVFIVKLSNAGNLIWAKQLATVNWIRSVATSIAVDASGNVYTTGFYEGTIDFDPGAGSANFISQGGTDCFISKLDTAGNYVWARVLQGTNSEEISSLVIDAADNLVLTGRFSGTPDFDPAISVLNLTSNGSTDIFICKLDTSGGLVWVKQIGGSTYDAGNAVVTDAGNNIYATGYYVETVDFDPGAGVSNLTGPLGAGQTYALKLDASGNFLWAQTALNTIAGSEGKAIAVDASGLVYIAGYFQNDADVNPGAGVTNLPVEGSDESYITALDIMGNFTLAVRFSCASSDMINDIATGPGGAIYSTGYYFGTADFDPSAQTVTHASNGQQDAFIHRLNDCVLNNDVTVVGTTLIATGAVGVYQWVDCSNGQAIAGATSQTFTPTGAGSYAAFISSASCSDTTNCVVFTAVTDQHSEVFSVYPNPAESNITIQMKSDAPDSQIEIFNATGQLVISEKPMSNTVTVELPQADGIYLVRITTNGASTTRTVIKE